MIEYRNCYDCDVCVNAIVGEDYKYVIYETGEEEYTDLAQDPEERRNVAGEDAYEQAVSKAAKALLLERLKAKTKGIVQYGHA